MARVRRLAAIALLAVIVLACSRPANDEGPGATLEEFYRYLNEADYANAMALYGTDAAEAWDAAVRGTATDFAAWALAETKHGRIERVRVLHHDVGADTARLDYELAYADGTTVKRSAELVREDGSWRMGPIG